jgi:hypothetical protein
LKTSSRASLWLVWGFLIFGVMNIYAPPDPNTLSASALSGATGVASAINNIMTLLRDDGDTRRYFAYSNAILGRPYDGFFLRTAADPARPSETDHVIVRPERRLIPWRDFTVEYPPGMLATALLPALLTSDFRVYHFLFGLLMEVLLTVSVWLCTKSADRISPGSGRDTLVLSIVFVAALGVVSVRRYDGAVALAISAAIYGLVARRPNLSGFSLAAGAIVKGTPLLLAPLGAIFWARQARFRELIRGIIACALTGAVAAAIYGLVAGPHALDTLAYHADRPVQIESPYGAFLMLAGWFNPGLVHIVSSYGSDNIQSIWEPSLREVASALPGLMIVGVIVWFWRIMGRAGDEETRHRALLAACTAILVAFIGFGKVFSPQYVLWLLPSGVIVGALSSERSRFLLIAAAAATQVEYPFIYQIRTPWILQMIGAVALTRDVLLLSCAVTLMIEASRAVDASRATARGTMGG